MNTETMTVHKALSELKVLDARIRKETRGLSFAVANKHGNLKISGVPVAEYIERSRDKYKSVRTLINRRNAIKQALTNSNAETKVTIDDREYSVAEAIDMKNFGVTYLRDVLNIMETQYSFAKNAADLENGEKLDRRADAHVQAMYEGADMKNMSEEIRKTRENFIQSQTVEVVTPIPVEEEMTKLRDYIDAFTVNVDAALSVSNALTTITVEYEVV